MTNYRTCKHVWAKKKYIAIKYNGYPFCDENTTKVYMVNCKKRCGVSLEVGKVKTKKCKEL